MKKQNEPASALCSGAWFAALVERCQTGRVPKVMASTQYNFGFLLADGGPHNGGIVFRDDSLSHAERDTLAERINAALANVV